ncbi:PRTRC system protein F [Acidithiobacillus caldus]|uniref:PRTRC system protein F n=3 Tax=Acidithiobacillus caldus TaxID=33059 RepID=A0A1E7Z111_9PROT|nr:PRTRC system protein F [Acidithiobacillus caldus]OFC35517.1 hypothetical protein BAE29_15300 [Acidithiobacillus caldus]OFC62431.1 hypothetical protein BAE30_01985 [Acidithiobacillus caldus]
MRSIHLASADQYPERQAELSALPNAPAPVLNSGLSLPTVSENIPVRFDQETEEVFRALGKQMFRMGIPMENDDSKDLEDIIEQGMQHALLHRCGIPDISMLHVSMQSSDTALAWHHPEAGSILLRFQLALDEAPPYRMQPGLEALRKASPALAWYFWSVCEKAARILPILTPSWFLDMVRHYEWMGEENEDLYIQEMVDAGAHPDDIAVVKRADVERVLQWSYRACLANPYRVRKHIPFDSLTRANKRVCELLDRCLSLSTGILVTTIYGDHHNVGQQYAVLPFMDDARRGGLYYQILDTAYRSLMEDQEGDFLFSLILHPDADESLDPVFAYLTQIAQLWNLVLELFALVGEDL